MADAKSARAAAKEAKSKAKVAARAEKERRKNSNDPADMGRIRQIRRAYEITHEYDKPLPFLLLGAFLGGIVVLLVIGFVIGQPVYLGILGLMVGLLAAMIVLVQRAKRATFKRYEGQAGSAEVALQMLPKKWVSEPAVAANKQLDVVHRALGPGGLVLIGEGEQGRLKALLASEVKKHERVAYGVEVITLQMGDKDGQIPLPKLADHIKKLPKRLQPHQITDIKQRLRALDAVRPKIAVPKGPMPTNPRQVRGVRQSMRGR